MNPPLWDQTYCTSSSASTPTIEELLDLQKKMIRRKEEVDRQFVQALVKIVTDGAWSTWVWAEKFDIPIVEFVEVLSGQRKPSWDFCDRVEYAVRRMAKKREERDDKQL